MDWCARSGVLLLVVAALSRSTALAVEITELKTSYESQGKTIAVERFAPQDEGKHPAVVVLHGAGGLRPEGSGPAIREFARHLARRGYVAELVHYFDRTGHETADTQAMKDHFGTWMTTIGDGVTNLASQPNVDPDRVGLLGFSLGAYLSLSESIFDPRVKAVVEYFGGMPPELVKDLKRMPPVLILHGDADTVVPVKEAEKLETLFKEKNVAYELKIYPGQGHGFTGADGLDAMNRALAFFDKHVKR